MGHVERDILCSNVIRTPECDRKVDLTWRHGDARGDAKEWHRRMQIALRDLHRFEDAQAQDLEPATPIYQHPPDPYVAYGGSDDDGETPHSLDALQVVNSAESDRGVRPLQGLTRLEHRCCSTDLTLKGRK